jgi:hypothetical protein
MIEPHADRPDPITLGADKGYDAADFVMELREINVTPTLHRTLDLPAGPIWRRAHAHLGQLGGRRQPGTAEGGSIATTMRVRSGVVSSRAASIQSDCEQCTGHILQYFGIQFLPPDARIFVAAHNLGKERGRKVVAVFVRRPPAHDNVLPFACQQFADIATRRFYTIHAFRLFSYWVFRDGSSMAGQVGCQTSMPSVIRVPPGVIGSPQFRQRRPWLDRVALKVSR